jgi:Ca2+-binding EF-hand superfamily protein
MGSWRSKKSETLEIRVSYDEKQALMQRAADEGRSASAILRHLIAQYMRPAPAKGGVPKLRWQPAATIALAACSLAIAYSVTTPATAVPDMRRLFDNLDRDHNGVIDPAEYAHQGMFVIASQEEPPAPSHANAAHPSVMVSSTIQLRDDFRGEDANGDGVVTYDEFLAYSHSLARRSFALMDVNRDGSLSLDEFEKAAGKGTGNAPRQLFEAKDKNHDGKLTFVEFNA